MIIVAVVAVVVVIAIVAVTYRLRSRSAPGPRTADAHANPPVDRPEAAYEQADSAMASRIRFGEQHLKQWSCAP